MEKKTHNYAKAQRAPLKFEVIRDSIITNIECGRLKTGDRIPSTDDICKSYDVAHSTVTTALIHLKKKGHIYFVDGIGHFVQGSEKKTSFNVFGYWKRPYCG